MFDVVADLMLHKQLVFGEGSIKLLNQTAVIFPLVTLFEVQKALEASNKQFELYLSSKRLGKLWIDELFRTYHMNTIEEQARWGEKAVTLAGFGKMKVMSWDTDKREMTYRLYESSMAKTYGNIGRAVDHIPRGWYAGATSTFFQEDIDAIEVKCFSKGDEFCEFIAKKPDEIAKHEEFKTQFPQK